MSYSAKIRLMLALLAGSLLLTAIIVRETYTPAHNLLQTARVLEGNLHDKEAYINNAINTPIGFNRFKNLPRNAQEGLKCINEFTTDKKIWVSTYNNNTLEFWSGNKVIPEEPSKIKEGPSFIRQLNGYYEAIKKSEGNFSVIFLIPVKTNYVIQNQYLQNTFARDLLTDSNIEIADPNDNSVYEIYSADDTYLFAVKLKPNEVNNRFFYFELTFWVLTFIVLCILIQNICSYFVRKEQVYLSIFILAIFIVLTRFINLHYHWPDFTYSLEVFNPSHYASSNIYPSLGDLCINILMLSWFSAFLYRHRIKLLQYTPGKITGYCILFACTLILIIISTALLNIFYGLVINSNISFDVNNVLNLSAYSFLGLLMLCFSFFIFFLLTEVFLTVGSRLNIPVTNRLFLFLAIIFLTTILAIKYSGFTLFYVFWSLIVLCRWPAYKNDHGRVTAGSLVLVIFICAFISSITLDHFQAIKERETRKALVRKLEIPDDSNAEHLFKKIEKQIITDTLISRYFTDTANNSDYLKTRLQKLYFDGYLAKYEFRVHEFNLSGQPISGDKEYSLDVFKEMVLYSSFKISNYFYRETGSFGIQNYFAILPVAQANKNLGSIVIELRSKALQTAEYFPELLIDGQTQPESDLKNYSYAFYEDNKLLSQSGRYVYDLVNTTFKGQVKSYVMQTTSINNNEWYRPYVTYSNLIYKPSDRKIIVVSKEKDTIFYEITALTFFFVVLLAFALMVIVGRWAWVRIKILTVTNNRIKWGFRISFDRVLYKTRIQFSMIAAVVVTLVLVGFITYISISTQYQDQQNKMIREKIVRITAAFEGGLFNKYMSNITGESQVSFDELASSYSSDLTLFKKDGVLLVTTQPRIYEYGLTASKMNSRAFINLTKLQRSEFINEEQIGTLNYKAAYAPLRNSRGETLAFLQLPYFSNEVDYNNRIGSLLNVMINIYALIFIMIGFFAVIIARQITTPLNFIQRSLSKTIYGKKNEPIEWRRDDEIGELVKEYNNMIGALEESAQKLAQSERESAWREMAKQVAHEIKNPLTPLKLGLQLLEKSWREKDPKFDQKFERFSKSFVEQIESLSSIASEFSAFAKMPDTRMEKFNVFDVLSQAVTIFKQMDNFRITYNQPETPFIINADRDQLLRCFNNLLKNAIEATPADRFGAVEINHEITGNNILLTIKDNGNGIPENMREKIFEPNFTTKSSGTGLGLAFVKNSIENAGGKVWFETGLNTGTTFFLSLPAANA